MTDSARDGFEIRKQADLSWLVLLDGDVAEEFSDKEDAEAYVRWISEEFEDVRQQTAKEIADWLDADAPTHDDGMYGGIATETLRQAAKKIREKYEVQP